MLLTIDVAPSEEENYTIISKYYDETFDFLIAIPNNTDVGTATVYLKVKVDLPRDGCGLSPISFNEAVTIGGAPAIVKAVPAPTEVSAETSDETADETEASATSDETSSESSLTDTADEATAAPALPAVFNP